MFDNGLNFRNIYFLFTAAFIIWAIVESSKYEYFRSESLFFWVEGSSPTCSPFLATAEEREALEDEALAICQAEARNPETCRKDGISWSHDDDDDDTFFTRTILCSVHGTAKADK